MNDIHYYFHIFQLKVCACLTLLVIRIPLISTLLLVLKGLSHNDILEMSAQMFPCLLLKKSNGLVSMILFVG